MIDMIGGRVAMDTVMRVADLKADANVHVVRRMFRALTTGDVIGADQFVSPHYVDHDAPGTNEARRWRGPAQFRESVKWFHRTFTGLEFEEQEVIAAGDRVVVRGVMRGRQMGELLGIVPMGRHVEVDQVHMFRLTDNKVTEHRAMWAELSLMLQLGVVPS